MEKADCIIIGSGLSGLACALTLKKQGFRATLYDAASTVGGRVASNVTESGFILDEGFQVLLYSYPEIKKFVDIDLLKLKSFNSGALIYNGDHFDLIGNPLVHPETLVSTLFRETFTAKDKALVLKLIAISQLAVDDTPLGEKSTLNFLIDFGFSEKCIEDFWRPFFAGIFLDPDLSLGENYFKFLIRCFSSGKVSVPEMGMNQLPQLMASQLDSEQIHLNSLVEDWGADFIQLADGRKHYANQIVCAFDPQNKKLEPVPYRSVETFYFTGDSLKELNWGKWLVLIPKKFGFSIDHLCLLSSVSDHYAPKGPLLSVSIIGNKNIQTEQVLKELNLLSKKDLKLKFLDKRTVTKALPTYSRSENLPGKFKVIDGVIYCGDRWSSPSINGALSSGREAAEFILRNKSDKSHE